MRRGGAKRTPPHAHRAGVRAASPRRGVPPRRRISWSGPAGPGGCRPSERGARWRRGGIRSLPLVGPRPRPRGGGLARRRDRAGPRGPGTASSHRLDGDALVDPHPGAVGGGRPAAPADGRGLSPGIGSGDDARGRWRPDGGAGGLAERRRLGLPVRAPVGVVRGRLAGSETREGARRSAATSGGPDARGGPIALDRSPIARRRVAAPATSSRLGPGRRGRGSCSLRRARLGGRTDRRCTTRGPSP